MNKTLIKAGEFTITYLEVPLYVVACLLGTIAFLFFGALITVAMIGICEMLGIAI